MLGRLYKKALNGMPAGVFVFDDKLRIRFTNAAFRRFFPDSARKSGSLREVICCGAEAQRCGTGEACVFCTFRKVMESAVTDKTEKAETATTVVNHSSHTDKITVRIRILPLGDRLFLGLTDGTYQTELAREMLSARQMQRRLLPAGKSMGGIPYSYMYIPCLEIGGDLPDVYELDSCTYGVLADVSGKGISAGMLSAFVRAGFDKTQKSLGKALSALSVKFRELNLDERSYITVAAVRIDKNQRKIGYSVAGHNAPILLKTQLGIDEIEDPAPPISNWIPDFVYGEKEISFEWGNILVLLTDGVTECANSAGELFGIERAESVLLQSDGAEDFIGKLKNALTVFSGGTFSDDITAIAFDL